MACQGVIPGLSCGENNDDDNYTQTSRCNGVVGKCFKSQETIFKEKYSRGGSMGVMMKKLQISSKNLEREKGKQNDSYARYLLKKKRSVVYKIKKEDNAYKKCSDNTTCS